MSTKQTSQALVKMMMNESEGGLEITVKSATTGKFYIVRKLGVGRWTCSCPDFRYRGGKPEVGSNGKVRKHICKHMKQLFNGKAEVFSLNLNAKRNDFLHEEAN